MTKLLAQPYYTEDDLRNEGFRSLGKNVHIARNCTIIGAENISIGNNVRIDGYCTLVASGCGYITLGSYIHIGGKSVLLAGEGIEMEDYSTLSWGVMVFTRTDDFSGQYMTNPTVPIKFTGVTSGAVLLKRHVVVGAGTVILPGLTLNEGVAVGALSLVRDQLMEWGIYCGVPAKKIKNRSRKLLKLEKELLAEQGNLNRVKTS